MKREPVGTYEFTEEDFIINYDYLGQGCGMVGNLERESIRFAACTEGLPLDPVYTGRANGGLIDLIKMGFFSEEDTVLYWHTGGAPCSFRLCAGTDSRFVIGSKPPGS